MGYSVKSHGCAEDVRTQMRFGRPRLLIVDCELPDGFALIESVRKDVRVVRTSMIVFSATADDDAVQLEQRALAHGADAFVAKGALDWALLRPHVLRLAGPPGDPSTLP